jgi:hypothetical protein
MDIRLVNQVVEWETRIERENEKNNCQPHEAYPYLLITLDYCQKVYKQIRHNLSGSVKSFRSIKFDQNQTIQ